VTGAALGRGRAAEGASTGDRHARSCPDRVARKLRDDPASPRLTHSVDLSGPRDSSTDASARATVVSEDNESTVSRVRQTLVGLRPDFRWRPAKGLQSAAGFGLWPATAAGCLARSQETKGYRGALRSGRLRRSFRRPSSACPSPRCARPRGRNARRPERSRTRCCAAVSPGTPQHSS
jgi:hypothetical protein